MIVCRVYSNKYNLHLYIFINILCKLIVRSQIILQRLFSISMVRYICAVFDVVTIEVPYTFVSLEGFCNVWMLHMSLSLKIEKISCFNVDTLIV